MLLCWGGITTIFLVEKLLKVGLMFPITWHNYDAKWVWLFYMLYFGNRKHTTHIVNYKSFLFKVYVKIQGEEASLNEKVLDTCQVWEQGLCLLTLGFAFSRKLAWISVPVQGFVFDLELGFLSFETELASCKATINACNALASLQSFYITVNISIKRLSTESWMKYHLKSKWYMLPSVAVRRLSAG